MKASAPKSLEPINNSQEDSVPAADSSIENMTDNVEYAAEEPTPMETEETFTEPPKVDFTLVYRQVTQCLS